MAHLLHAMHVDREHCVATDLHEGCLDQQRCGRLASMNQLPMLRVGNPSTQRCLRCSDPDETGVRVKAQKISGQDI